MEIIALGNEVVECVRIREMIDRHGEAFLRRAFTDREVRYCQARRQSTEHFARIWAAKESVLKCLRVSGNVHRSDVEIWMDNNGQTRISLHCAARERAQELKIGDWLVTVAHCRAFATATAIALREGVAIAD